MLDRIDRLPYQADVKLAISKAYAESIDYRRPFARVSAEQDTRMWKTRKSERRVQNPYSNAGKEFIVHAFMKALIEKKDELLRTFQSVDYYEQLQRMRVIFQQTS